MDDSATAGAQIQNKHTYMHTHTHTYTNTRANNGVTGAELTNRPTFVHTRAGIAEDTNKGQVYSQVGIYFKGSRDQSSRNNFKGSRNQSVHYSQIQ